jgi:hypothetical protein
LHLHEVDNLLVLNIFEHLNLPELVLDELERYNLNVNKLDIKTKISVIHIDIDRSKELIEKLGQPTIHLADAGVFILAQNMKFTLPVLTDDLALRRHYKPCPTKNSPVGRIAEVGDKWY